ncbi:MAG: Long-chain-fatty-acid--CoA ligase [uncultured Acidimicrobiales bacterium]|uniref:Long-chain-fatty-acid--CoA ligase n=1 Tax=uncultured Acidimicrobiales bacterium TaxID=310071 RepID=A0A6J4I3Q7_9ACTN|nr:MAG: Long-chain-fatty-acid--CoA ligase [uncultured Acidimicrobiales bacterium]
MADPPPDPATGPPSLRAVLELRAAELGPRPFLTLPDATLTYGETDELANRVASVLSGLGYGAGDIVMVRAVNGWATVAAWFGCSKIGAVYLPLNALLTGEPLRQVMAHSRSPVILVQDALAAEVQAVRQGLPDLRDVVVVGGPGGGEPRLEDLLEEASSASPPPLVDDPGAPTKLMYTSGTTGVPKGAVVSRSCEALWARCYGDELMPIARGEAVYTCLPLFHITGQGTVLAALWRGGRMTVDPGFSLLSFWRRIREAEAVMFTFVGTILSALARRPPHASDRDNPVRQILGGGAPVDRWREVEERFGVQIMETWGQTETGSCYTWPIRGLPQRPGTIGMPSARWEARIADDEGRPLGPEQTGELWAKPLGPHVMFDGYLGEDGLDAPTREAFTEDGWYRTGDLMAWTEDGELSFVGRQRDAIRRAGEMISPSFIEEAALAHPGVVEAAAVGVPADDGVEEEVLLCVVASEGVELDLAEVASFLAQALPPYLVPRWLRAHLELPKTASTRVRKFQLRELGTAGAWDSRRRRWAPLVESS